jgi:retrotransposon-encoded endonuclease
MAEDLLGFTGQAEMELATAPGTVTWRRSENSTIQSTIDLVFLSTSIAQHLVSCQEDMTIHHGSDHIPIATLAHTPNTPTRGAPSMANPEEDLEANGQRSGKGRQRAPLGASQLHIERPNRRIRKVPSGFCVRSRGKNGPDGQVTSHIKRRVHRGAAGGQARWTRRSRRRDAPEGKVSPLTK